MSTARTSREVVIGGASGFWGDSVTGPMQLVASGRLDFLVFDYLAELTMSLLASARLKDPSQGYATDFVGVAMRAVLRDALAQNIRIIANAGGVNPRACASALQALADELGVSVRIAVVEGDDVMPLLPALRGEAVRELQTGQPLPEKMLSANAYFGALPIKAALDAGAQVVITGRCVDSAVTLGALMHSFGWAADDHDRLAAGSLAGHIIECGCQGAGGLYTDWEDVPDWAHSGYPIVECRADGGFTVTKPEGSGGLVTPATVGEQMLYEIGDPARYVLPDVVCDFTEVTMTQAGMHRVDVRGARGRAPTPDYKVSATYVDGYRASGQLTVVGFEADRKARRTAEAILERTRGLFRQSGLADYSATHIETLGSAYLFGPHQPDVPHFESVMWLAVAHPQKQALELFAREIAAAATSWAPGTTGAGGRPGVVPAIKQFAFLLDKTRLQPRVTLQGGEGVTVDVPRGGASPDALPSQAVHTAAPVLTEPAHEVPLIALAHARSGDKGDTSNIGVIPRRPEDLPLLRAQLTEDAVAAYLAHLVRGRVMRYELPGIHAMNFVCEQALGGGGMASLRNDALGKGMAQVLLSMPVRVPADHPAARPRA
ncbi:acyclic terpene utilization AtuA family protein [Dyella sp. EPa41]|uniref:acyclic terpene utilization AtuA family protein n=1 Tax=Dyella sp. EPa41 TaxID=1561194 RepID=UPI00191556FD|nr:acyclic terpene utilization AtuA family protein [Dyella sp. EPa41]